MRELSRVLRLDQAKGSISLFGKLFRQVKFQTHSLNLHVIEIVLVECCLYIVNSIYVLCVCAYTHTQLILFKLCVCIHTHTFFQLMEKFSDMDKCREDIMNHCHVPITWFPTFINLRPVLSLLYSHLLFLSTLGYFKTNHKHIILITNISVFLQETLK